MNKVLIGRASLCVIFCLGSRICNCDLMASWPTSIVGVISTGHKVKNEQSNISLALRKLHFVSVLLLTGTPLQVVNSLRVKF